MTTCDVLIIGAGPAGMATAMRLRKAQIDVIVVDDASAPGGQVWRAAERNAGSIASALGTDYSAGRDAIAQFRASGARYLAETEVWRLDDGWRAFTKHYGAVDRIDAKFAVLATGALERPVPFPGWTLPGVMTVGGAQTLLKGARQIPEDGVWIAGSGPLVLLYMAQLRALGGRIAGWMNTAPRSNLRAALRHWPAMVRNALDLGKGMTWRAQLALSSVPVIDVRDIAAEGDGRLQSIRYTTTSGKTGCTDANLLLVHEGVVPNIHATVALGCAHHWSSQQQCFVPQLDAFRMTSRDNLYVVGDGGGILGARAACFTGELAALGILERIGRISKQDLERESAQLRARLEREVAFRRFLDALFLPRPAVLSPGDETIVCRCEEVTARSIRQAASVRGSGPNQIKAFTRAGMGPCQGRQCGLVISQIVGVESGKDMDSVGYLNIRPPLKPITIGEIARAAKLEDH
jgi:NADPH-dependent 2,4-dienoyl-CoA reductase/sulfur reductase-like enzyme